MNSYGMGSNSGGIYLYRLDTVVSMTMDPYELTADFMNSHEIDSDRVE
jgi:hypothetical protein